MEQGASCWEAALQWAVHRQLLQQVISMVTVSST